MLLLSIQIVGNLRFLTDGGATLPILVPHEEVASYLVVLCLSAWSAYLFGFGSRCGKHRVNCQFSTHEILSDAVCHKSCWIHPATEVVGYFLESV